MNVKNLFSGLISIFLACINIYKIGKHNKQFDVLNAIIFVLYFWTLCCVYVYRVETKEVSIPFGYNVMYGIQYS